MSLTPRPFSCCCCDHSGNIPSGSHLLSTTGDEPLFDGSCEISCQVVSCTNCSHEQVHPISFEEDIRKFYKGVHFWQSQGMSDEFTNQPWLQNLTYNAGLWERFRNAQSQLQFILNQTNLNKNAKIIDLGSGYAPFLYHCRQKGFNNLYALEPSKEICHYLEGQGIVTYPMLLETFITQDDLPQFDLIVLSHTLEHLLNPGQVLLSLRRLMSEKGVMFIEVPYQELLRTRFRNLHLHFFNEISMTHLLSRCGYRTILIHPKRHSFLEAALIKTLYLIHRETYIKKRTPVKSMLESPLVKYLHLFCWRPLKLLLGLRLNLYITSHSLIALATR